MPESYVILEFVSHWDDTLTRLSCVGGEELVEKCFQYISHLPWIWNVPTKLCNRENFVTERQHLRLLSEQQRRWAWSCRILFWHDAALSCKRLYPASLLQKKNDSHNIRNYCIQQTKYLSSFQMYCVTVLYTYFQIIPWVPSASSYLNITFHRGRRCQGTTKFLRSIIDQMGQGVLLSLFRNILDKIATIVDWGAFVFYLVCDVLLTISDDLRRHLTKGRETVGVIFWLEI